MKMCVEIEPRGPLDLGAAHTAGTDRVESVRRLDSRSRVRRASNTMLRGHDHLAGRVVILMRERTPRVCPSDRWRSVVGATSVQLFRGA